jgi:hypothetical protein
MFILVDIGQLMSIQEMALLDTVAVHWTIYKSYQL